MKICAIICEYNPFHNGHLHQIKEARRLSGADAVLCLMSGNFVQRGEAAVMEKYTRAKHAVLAGADVVIELPTLFATSNAELFAKGAVHILSAIPEITTLSFGAETADKQAFLSAAPLLNDEPKEISEKIKTLIGSGASYAKARAEAWKTYLPSDLLTSPNNVLGLEYTRAILAANATIDILPIPRIGGGYREETLSENYSSATAIRAAIAIGASVDGNLPDFVKRDLPKTIENCLDTLEKYEILQCDVKELAQICDCTEGLENAFKRAAERDEPLSQALTSARYTSSRIRRIALQNLLKIRKSTVREALKSPLYLRVLAVNRERKELLSALSKTTAPLLLRAHDEDGLTGIAKDCFAVDRFAEKMHALLYPQNTKKNIFY